MKNTNAAIILLSEARITSDITDDELHNNNYRLYKTDSDSRHTGCVAAYVRCDITVKNVERLIFERNFWLIAIEIKINNWNATIACIYHSPSSNDNEFTVEFINWCNDAVDKHENLIITGDFNIDWMVETPTKRKIAEEIIDLGLTQLVNCPTRIANSSSTLIYWCISSDKSIKVSAKSDLNISDHECLSIKMNNISKITNDFKIIDSIGSYERQRFAILCKIEFVKPN